MSISLPKIGFNFSTDQLFWLVALPSLSGATLRTLTKQRQRAVRALATRAAEIAADHTPADITQLGKVYAAGSFRFFETYNVVAFLYLNMTIGLGLAIRALERRGTVDVLATPADGLGDDVLLVAATETTLDADIKILAGALAKVLAA